MGASAAMRRIERAAHALAAALQYMRRDHGCTDILVPQEFLHGTNIIAIFQEVCGEAVSERVAAPAFVNAGTPDGVLHCLLEARFRHVVSPFDA